MKRNFICQDKYEAQKLARLIFIKDGKETFIKEILNTVDNEIIISLKDKSAHSVLLKNKEQVEAFADFVQSIIEQEHEIEDTLIVGTQVVIIKN